jgi:hypothetical protein
MSNVFDFKRFGNYFGYSLRNGAVNFGLSLLICALMPAVVFVFYELIMLVFSGNFPASSEWLRDFAAVLGLIVAVMIAPAKLFGCITDKSRGTAYLMIPASTFEKWLSVILICILVLPLCFLALMVAGDALMMLIFGSAYADQYLFTYLCQSFNLDLGELKLNAFAFGYADWITGILTYALGAVWFKKAKVGKTLLCMMLLSVIIGLLFSGVSQEVFFSDESLLNGLEPNAAATWVNVFCNAIVWIWAALLAAAIYLRLKTIKH